MKPDNNALRNARSTFASNFKTYLSITGKTQADVANHLMITSSTVSDWANAKKYPRVDKMQALADYLGISMSDLREEKPAISEDDRLLEKISKNEKIKYIASKLVDLDQSELERLEQIIDVVLRK